MFKNKDLYSKYGGFLLTISLLGTAIPALAHEEGSVAVSVEAEAQTTSNHTEVRAEASSTAKFQGIKADIKEIHDEMKTARASTSATIKLDREAFKAKLEAMRKEAVATFNEHRIDLKTRLDAFKDAMKDKREEMKAKLESSVKARVEMHLNVIIKRFNNVTERLTNISGRLATRIETLEEQGNDMDESISLLADADAKLAAAKDDIAKVDAQIKTELNTETSKENLKALIATAKESLKVAHAAYVKVITSIKGESGVEVHGKASTTSSINQ